MKLQESRESPEVSPHGDNADAVRPALAIKGNGRFYAGVAAFAFAVIVMPLSAFVVPSLGLPAMHVTILFGVLGGVADGLCIVAISLLGKEIFQYYMQMTESALRGAVDRRFRAGGATHVIFDKCLLIFSLAERYLDRLYLVSLICTRVWLRVCRNAVVLPSSPEPSSCS
jgi:hypothetical protein